jgi:hypothetical protein
LSRYKINQGEQVRPFFYFGEVFWKLESNPNNVCIGIIFFHGKSYVLIATKNALDYILGDFFHKRIWNQSYDFLIYNYNASVVVG